MGRQIAVEFAVAGFSVLICDKKKQILKSGLEKINQYLENFFEKNKISYQAKQEIVKRIIVVDELKNLSDCDFLFEAVVEDIEEKRNIFSALDKICIPEAIFATNTSTILVSLLSLAVERKDKFIGMHFMNPVSIIKLVEIIRGKHTSDKTVAATKEIALALGKTPLEIKDSPGFAVNRILIPMINEAVFCLQENVATRDNIDNAMKIGANFPMGPLALADLIGLDICLRIMQELQSGFGNKKYRPCPLLEEMVAKNRLGRKTGEGFYDYK